MISDLAVITGSKPSNLSCPSKPCRIMALWILIASKEGLENGPSDCPSHYVSDRFGLTLTQGLEDQAPRALNDRVLYLYYQRSEPKPALWNHDFRKRRSE